MREAVGCKDGKMLGFFFSCKQTQKAEDFWVLSTQTSHIFIEGAVARGGLEALVQVP